MATKSLPRGIRNNNPGNIEWGDPWQGLDPLGHTKDSRFAVFATPVMGIRALARTLITYYDKHGIDTIEGAIRRWAPPTENNTSAYVGTVAFKAGIPSTKVVDFHDYDVLRTLVMGIIRHENGDPLKHGVAPTSNASEWYTDEVIDEALRLAGVKPTAPKAGPVPITRETVGATVAAGAGATQLAEVAPAVVSALSNAEDHITSGDWVRIAFAVVTIVAAVAIAWSQLRRHRQGTL